MWEGKTVRMRRWDVMEMGMRWDGRRFDKGDGRLVGWDVLDKREHVKRMCRR